MRALIVCGLLALPCLVHAADPVATLNLNGIQVGIGMDKTQVLDELAATGQISKMSKTQDVWCLQTTDETNNSACAELWFRGGKVWTISKPTHSASDADAAKLLLQLYSIIEEAEKQRLPVFIYTALSNADKSAVSMNVRVGPRLYILDVSQPSKAHAAYVSLTEELVSPIPPDDAPESK